MVEKERTDPKENEVEVLALRLDYLEVKSSFFFLEKEGRQLVIGLAVVVAESL